MNMSEKQVSLVKGTSNKKKRQVQILQALARLLENTDGDKITTARLASAINLSEASLYRCFSGKAAMYDGLLDFVDESLMNLFTQVREMQGVDDFVRIQSLVTVMLDFAAVNPGLTKVLTGHALVYEDQALHERLQQIHAKCEFAIRQLYKQAVLAEALPADFNINGRASMVFCVILGRWNRFVVSGFKERPNGLGANTLQTLVMP